MLNCTHFRYPADDGVRKGGGGGGEGENSLADQRFNLLVLPWFYRLVDGQNWAKLCCIPLWLVQVIPTEFITQTYYYVYMFQFIRLALIWLILMWFETFFYLPLQLELMKGLLICSKR